jgi:glycosyltransferase involved in cell wall biosynthesis
VLYQMGNSEFHAHMVEMLEAVRGVVVMHDCYLSGMLDYLDRVIGWPGAYYSALFHSHGYAGLWYEQRYGRDAAIREYPCNQLVKSRSRHIIVHSNHAAQILEDGTLKPSIGVIPLIMPSIIGASRARALAALELPPDACVVATFGSIHENKCSKELFEACLESEHLQREHCYLIYVGDDHQSPYGRELREQIQRCGMSKKVKVTGYVDPLTYQHYLSAATVAMQLRANSRGETSAAILECLAAGLPLITNAHGSAAELPDTIAIKLSDSPVQTELATALDQLLSDTHARERLAASGLAYIADKHSPAQVAKALVSQIEQAYRNGADKAYDRLIERLGEIRSCESTPTVPWMSIARDIASTQGASRKPQYLIDITAHFVEGEKLAAQVEQAIADLLLNPPEHYAVEVVYRKDGSYWYARRFIGELLELVNIPEPDQLLLTVVGDKWFLPTSLLSQATAQGL